MHRLYIAYMSIAFRSWFVDAIVVMFVKFGPTSSPQHRWVDIEASRGLSFRARVFDVTRAPSRVEGKYDLPLA